MATYEKSFLLSLYRDMVRIRAFEEHAAECFTKGMLAGNIHLSIGQEAAEAGATPSPWAASATAPPTRAPSTSP